MKVILLSNVPNLGKIDEVKEVSDGYARNYLFARNLAIAASKTAVVGVAVKEKKKKKEAESDLQKEQAMAEKLDGYELEISKKASEGGSLYAAINAGVVVSTLKKKGYSISKKQVKMDPIKEAGQYDIVIAFSHGLEAKVSLTVLAK